MGDIGNRSPRRGHLQRILYHECGFCFHWVLVKLGIRQTNAGERKDLHSNRKVKEDQMEAKLIYPKWIGGKSQIEFPRSPIKGQMFKFIDRSSEDWAVNIHVYTGSKWVKMKSQEFAPKGKVQAITNRMKPIR